MLARRQGVETCPTPAGAPPPRPAARMTELRLFRLPCLPAVLALPLLLGAAGCQSVENAVSQPIQARGNRVDSDMLSQLVVGTATKGDVLAVMGSPTAKASFDENTWLYITALTKPVIAATNRIEEQNVYAMVFDGQGVLRDIKKRDQSDSLPVQVVSRTTPTPGNEATFLQQLLGNIGKFSPGQMGRSGGNY